MKAGHFVYSRPNGESVELIAVEDETRVRLLTPIEAVNLGADLFRHAAEIIRKNGLDLNPPGGRISNKHKP